MFSHLEETVDHYFILHWQGDADYLRYHGMQEFDQAMQHLEEKYGVCTV
jgi:hypothetical protein